MPTIDRLSVLPDAIICHTLSFLPTKLSVKTSILSRRWRLLWTYVPTLDFKVNDEVNGMEVETETSFSDIINRVLLLNTVQSIRTFRLPYYSDDCSEYQLQTWITTAISRNVQNLDISFRRIVMLPRCLFKCRTLVELRLHFCGGIPSTGDVCLPALKKLHLTSFQYETVESLPLLLSGCPVLEYLRIRGIMDRDLSCCTIYSPTIKKLKIDFCLYSFGFFNGLEKIFPSLEINAPTLQYLKVADHLPEHIKAAPLTSLIEADICLIDMGKEDRSVLEFVNRLCNVKSLKFDFYNCDGVPDSAFSASSGRFDNLTELQLGADCRFLSRFLEKANNLEILIYEEICEEASDWVEPQQVPTCLLSHLRTVKMDQHSGTAPELDVVRYLLSYGKVLERMEIRYSSDHKSVGRSYVVEKISQFQRVSKACVLVFS